MRFCKVYLGGLGENCCSIEHLREDYENIAVYYRESGRGLGGGLLFFTASGSELGEGCCYTKHLHQGVN